MGLIVQAVEVTGFGSYGPTTQRLTLGGRGPVAIIGENGAGKSTIVSKALTWGLYGRTPPERMGTSTKMLRGDSVIGSGDSARVAVRLRDPDNNVDYDVIRAKTRKTTDTLSLVRHDSAGTHELDASQEAVDALVGADYDTWCRVVVRAQGDTWAFAEATDARKRELLDSLTGAAALDKAYDHARSLRKTAESAASLQAKRHGDLTQRGGEAAQRAEAFEASSVAWEAGREARRLAAVADVDAARVMLRQAQAADEARALAASQHAELAKTQPALDLTPYHDAVREASAAVRDVQRRLDAAEAEARRTRGLSVGAACPTCGQTIGHDAPVAGKQNAAVAAVAAERQPLADATAFLTEAEDALRDASEWLAGEQHAWAASVRALPAVGSAQVPAGEAAVTLAESRLDAVLRAANPYEVALGEAKALARSLAREAALVGALVEAERGKAAAAQAWEDALHPQGARAALASAALAAVEARANEWLTVLSEGRIAVEFPEDAKKETIATRVIVDGVERDLLTLSGGERRRVHLAVDLGIAAASSRSGLAISLLVLDEEVFSGLDEGGKASVVHALHGAGVADVVVIDHDPRLSAVLPRAVIVERDPQGYSAVREVVA
jgi:DNA repair exonuclease SbcCD ATPase subunit